MRVIISIILMVIAALVGFFFGAGMNEAMGGAILLSMITGFACTINAIEKNKKDWQLPVLRIEKIGICGGKECMKKELRILVILIAVLLVGTVGYYFMPKKFGKNVNPSEVDHINVFDGNTGTGFTITDSEDIEYIVANIQGISMKRDGISLGRTGYSFKISYINSNDKDIIPVFILNSDNTICKDPFFYRCDGGLCFDYLKACEEKYRTNVTESIEEK